MKRLLLTCLLVVGAAVTVPIAGQADDVDLRALLHLPDDAPLPRVPAGNPLTAEKIALGRALFYDVQLSGNQTQSCASCHLQQHAFSDAQTVPTGSTGHNLARNAQPLFNLGYMPHYTWASTALTTLETQIHIPIRAENPVELGVNDGNADAVLNRFSSDARYDPLFRAAFPESASGPTYQKIVMALASFLRTMTSFDSAVDRFMNGDISALNAEEQRGLALFNGKSSSAFTAMRVRT